MKSIFECPVASHLLSGECDKSIAFATSTPYKSLCGCCASMYHLPTQSTMKNDVVKLRIYLDLLFMYPPSMINNIKIVCDLNICLYFPCRRHNTLSFRSPGQAVTTWLLFNRVKIQRLWLSCYVKNHVGSIS